ncbi:hypothetical protein [Streptomyces sp. NPDC056987]|uniref:hypothetical protein n=1 Tax=Streptomyces sp. NPDC056987 TaxID=3345988 RepID=UPI00363B4073
MGTGRNLVHRFAERTSQSLLSAGDAAFAPYGPHKRIMSFQAEVPLAGQSVIG